MVKPSDLESGDVTLFLVKCPPGFDASMLADKMVATAGLRKRARLTAGFDLVAAPDAEAAQMVVMLPVAPSVVGGADDSDSDEDAGDAAARRTSNLRVVRKAVSATALHIVAADGGAPPLPAAPAAGLRLGPVVLTSRAPLLPPSSVPYLYRPLGAGGRVPDDDLSRGTVAVAAAAAAPAADDDAPKTASKKDKKDKKEKHEKHDKHDKKERR